jgi:hypothetical protein
MAQEYDKYRDSYYSTYQTDDKKYECRTGLFEGFLILLILQISWILMWDSKFLVLNKLKSMITKSKSY